MDFANTPKPPYYTVIFTSLKNNDTIGYNEMAERMIELVKNEPGFLGVESARENIGITVSYWTDLTAIKNWKDNIEHQEAQTKGKTEFYKSFKVRIGKIERDYQFGETV